MVCRGICIRFKASGKSINEGRYIKGQKRCQRCDTIFILLGIYLYFVLVAVPDYDTNPETVN